MSPRPLRIGLEMTHACERHPTGVERYSSDLAAALARRGDADVRSLTHLKRFARRALRPHPPGARTGWYAAGFLLPLHGIDILHGLDCRVPATCAVPSVITVHDLMWELPIAREWGNDANRSSTRARRLDQALARVRGVVAVSATTRDDLVQVRGMDPARIAVVWEGVDPRFAPQEAATVRAVRARLGLDRPYVLHVGSIMPRKNLVRLAEAFAAAGLARGHDLVFAGKDGGDLERIAATAARLGFAERVRHLSYVEDADLPPLYAGAAALAFPSLYEGFGLPVLEGMACGAPVVTSNRSGTKEVAAGHAELVDPLSVEAIADGLLRGLRMPGAQTAAAMAHARACTWDRAAEGTLAFYRRILAG